MDREQLLAEATAAVCGPIIEDYRKGRFHGLDGTTPETVLEERVRRRMPQIREWMRERVAAKRAARCCECGRAADTVMGGADYCAGHAKNHRLSLPARIGVAA